MNFDPISILAAPSNPTPTPHTQSDITPTPTTQSEPTPSSSTFIINLDIPTVAAKLRKRKQVVVKDDGWSDWRSIDSEVNMLAKMTLVILKPH